LASFLNFISKAVNTINSVFGTNGSCIFALSCDDMSVNFPVTPGSYKVDTSQNNTTININGVGDINMMGKRGLNSISFDSFFPAQSYSFVEGLADDPYNYVDRVLAMKDAGKSARLVISGTNISTPVTIERFSYSEKDGSGDVYFSIELKEYRYITQSNNVVNEVTNLQSRVAETSGNRQINVSSGMDAMTAAARTMQGVTRIADQGAQTIQLYKALIKSGGINAGDVIRMASGVITKNGKKLEV
jgi:hypothetical protein